MPANHNEIARAHIWLRGVVQGVGFRAHVESYALRFGLMGWVRNVDDDVVETVAEGNPDTVNLFITMIRKGPRMSRIDETRVEWEVATGEFTGFGVKATLNTKETE